MNLPKDSAIGQLMGHFPNAGIITWIGLRPERRLPVQAVDKVEAIAGKGLLGDHYQGRSTSNRQVTLIQEEHLSTVASFLSIEKLDPALVRRNIVVKGLNLLALKDKQFYIGDVLLEMTGLCQPCSRMEEVLGPGGYNAMRGHGGITAKILQGGIIQLGDQIVVTEKEEIKNPYVYGKGL
ncbi:MOSC domain-containing protein [Cytophagaceae bacterium DM2B3-1]|uniref:MOSC domain-containing protein n=1 Tax=Xanthocytophaga flava TaxID=3048013 RepID=A0AAE3QXL5_9BACT|nr:MOSC domain-containing protein [Xanthocytophaga flavus]MDJ1484358.1 MOSC domain-containing protein [Xanthocytophaga flavus]MDJ1495137.1 MOSC domain-containing protein [Xanthocytophaga flavus]